MKKYLFLMLALSSALFAYSTVSEANQEIINNMLSYEKDGNTHLGDLFVYLQTKLFENAYLFVIVLVPLVFFIHYMIIGPKKFKHDGKKYYVFTLFNRIIHGIAAISFIIIIPTGLIMMFGSTFGGGEFVKACKELHAVATVLFMISVIPMFLMWLKSMLFTGEDIKWFMILGGYLSKEKKPVPAGKFNAGQKMWFWVCTIGGVMMIFTGATLYVQDLNLAVLTMFGLSKIEMLRLCIIAHNTVGLAMVALFFTHVYMSIFAIKGAILSIINGYKEEEEVAILHSSYYKELEKNKK
ncbi:formate dehydrogenase subunit gamma [Poseidonibacter lekithochrous]|uniref:formate dehydrogenase subunit gamma n=1 Tax=Poseidonibacter lekithochrous TaxID=1904463 RepID=UPI0008FCC7F3|nr:formate dehydrogenase subunit gamma [Poseidonibacter lekithochrous]QKJ23042.1 formate dehydrogenase N, cytochrome b-556 subunit [Poseidonibacter lekithochrous]